MLGNCTTLTQEMLTWLLVPKWANAVVSAVL